MSAVDPDSKLAAGAFGDPWWRLWFVLVFGGGWRGEGAEAGSGISCLSVYPRG
jgi:hypothetical protein